MAVTEFDYPSWQGGIGGGAAGALFSSITQPALAFVHRQGKAWVVGNVVGLSLWVFGPGKLRTAGKLILLIPWVDLIVGNAVVYFYDESEDVFFGTSVSSGMWIGPGTVFYVR